MLPELRWRFRRGDGIMPRLGAAHGAPACHVVAGKARAAQAASSCLTSRVHANNLTGQCSFVLLRPMVGRFRGASIRRAYGRMSQSSWSMHCPYRTLPSVTDPGSPQRPSQPPPLYSSRAAACRMLQGDAYHEVNLGTAHRLVDSRGLRALPRHHTKHLDCLRRQTAGAWPRPDVRPVPRLATGHRPELGHVPATPGPLDRHLSPSETTAPVLYSVGAVRSDYSASAVEAVIGGSAK